MTIFLQQYSYRVSNLVFLLQIAGSYKVNWYRIDTGCSENRSVMFLYLRP